MNRTDAADGTVGSGDFRYCVENSWNSLTSAWAGPDVTGIAVDGEDNVLLLSPDSDLLQKFSSERHLIWEWDLKQISGAAPIPAEQGPARKITYPHSVTVAPDGAMYIVDMRANVVRKMRSDGSIEFSIGVEGQGSDTGAVDDFRAVSRSGGPFNGPTKVAIGPAGDFFVSDGYRNARIHHFVSNGELNRSWGSPGEGPGQFRLPHALAVSDDRVIVADRENNRLSFFDLEGEYLYSWTGLSRPADIAVDEDGYIYVVELGLYATTWDFLPPDSPGKPASGCSIWDPEGRLVARWGSRRSEDLGSFFAPHCIAVDSCGDIYVGEVNLIRIWPSDRLGLGPWGFRNLQKFVRI